MIVLRGWRLGVNRRRHPGRQHERQGEKAPQNVRGAALQGCVQQG
jgi:hypothetical protein